MNEPFEEMAIFATIAQKGSFTAAADALGRSKAYVSQQTSKLEEILGTQLLFRTTRKVSLTEAGKVYLGYCQDIIKSAKDAKRAIAALQGEMTGLISISTPNSFGEIMVSDVLSQFQEIYPDIQINLDLSDDKRDLKNDDIDMTIRGGIVEDEDLVAIPLIKRQMLIVGAPDYFKKFGVPQHPTELKNHNCIGYRFETTVTGWPFMIDGKVERLQLDGNFSVNRNPMIKQTVLNGKGLAFLPSYVVHRELVSGALVSVLGEYSMPAFSFYLTYVYQRAIPLRQRRLIDFIKTWFEEHDTPGLHNN